MGPKKQSHGKKPSQNKKSGSDGDIRKFFKCNEENKQNSPLEKTSPKRKRSLSSTPSLNDNRSKQKRQSLSMSNTPPDEEEQELTINLGDGGKDHVVKGRIHDSIYTAMMALPDVCARQAKEKGKEMHLLGKKGIEGYVNLGMPLACLPENSHFEMKFYKVAKDQKKTDVVGNCQYDSKGKKFIIFYVHPVGNIWKSNSRKCRILRCWQLARDLNKLCVFAPEGETIKNALCKDGRFHSCLVQKEWRLMENQQYRRSNHRVNKLANRSFEVVVTNEKCPKAGKEHSYVASGGDQGKTSGFFKPAILELYPELKKQGTVINEFFAKDLKKGKSSSAVFKLYRENFGKETKNSTPIKVYKRLAVHSDSVGYIEWDNNGNRGHATCFVLCEKYILTCHHVARYIVGDGVEEKDWALAISRSARVTFSYEDKFPMENSWFSLIPWFEIYDKDLDFAVLELEGDGSLFPAGLVQLSYPLPFNGLIYIIGHPEEDAKSVDGCTVVPVFEREKKCHSHIQHGQEEMCTNVTCGSRQCIHMFTQRSFQDVINNPKIVTYDTGFFSGSSGSPAFDADGRLVAMHAAGYRYEKDKQVHSIVEFGFSMVAILAAIEKKDEVWYKSKLSFRREEARSHPNQHEDSTSDCPNDIEMESLE